MFMVFVSTNCKQLECHSNRGWINTLKYNRMLLSNKKAQTWYAQHEDWNHLWGGWIRVPAPGNHVWQS